MSNDRKEKALLYTLGMAEELVRKGLLTGGKYRFSRAGWAEFEKLRASRFKPTNEELEWAVHAIQADAAD